MSYTAPQPYPGYRPYQPPARTNTLAIVSFVSAFFISLLAIITGHIALSQIRRTGERGSGFAIAGLVIGYIGLIPGLIFFFAFIGAASHSATGGYQPPAPAQVAPSQEVKQPTVDFDDMKGETLEDAEQQAVASGLKYTVVSPTGTEPTDPQNWQVTSQRPTPQETLHAGDTITFAVQQIPADISVPNVKGMTGSQAKAELESRGLLVNFSDDSADLDTWKVTSTSPAAGKKVRAGDAISITVKLPVPKGYKECGDGLYCKWGSSGGNEYLATETMMVYTVNGCSFLYAEVNLLDSSGTVVGYTNDLASNISPGGKVKLTFMLTSDEAETATTLQPTELNCY